jgi:diketogulonate reductase-like aldo/keto reductase
VFADTAELEYHPYVLAHLDEVQAIHDEHGIVVEAYGPLTPILRHPGGPLKPVLDRLAEKYKTEAASILLRWTIQKNVVAVTTSTNTSRLAGLVGVYDLKLTSEEMAEIEEAGRKVHFRHYGVSRCSTDRDFR